MAKLENNIPHLKDFLDEKSFKYESPSFIKDDPILIPHRFTNYTRNAGGALRQVR